jgi:hypothetical protein
MPRLLTLNLFIRLTPSRSSHWLRWDAKTLKLLNDYYNCALSFVIILVVMLQKQTKIILKYCPHNPKFITLDDIFLILYVRLLGVVHGHRREGVEDFVWQFHRSHLSKKFDGVRGESKILWRLLWTTLFFLKQMLFFKPYGPMQARTGSSKIILERKTW